MDSPSKQYQNRLKDEQSPYLLQHADNPVDWYPWGKEAFEKAKKEDKPIFLSIGYSTCHWCHVMEHESFEDPDIARMINEYFVPIKVDREERPDIDNIYMSAVQAMTGRGGWPLSIFMTADKKPFFGGTYFPPEAKWGSPGFTDILQSIHKAWTNNRNQLLESSVNLTELLADHSPGSSEAVSLDENVLTRAYERFLGSYDEEYGGFGRSPKFPTSHNLSFLLRYWYQDSQEKALEMAVVTLRQMAEGGMYDHIGGGFHRYSTDQMWQIPHFEKMLYDQATLAKTYLEAYQATDDAFFAEVARDIFEYVLRDMQDQAGGFYSAEDADSVDPNEEKANGQQQPHKKEGAFYIWRYDEVKELLDEETFDVFSYRFDLREGGNAHSDPHNEFGNKNIIFTKHSYEETAQQFNKTKEEVKKILEKARKKLFDKREKRPRPHLDDKVLSDWNGLMISGLAFGSRVLNEPKYLQAAKQAADFIADELVDKDGRLLHRYREGESGITGTIEDYAFVIHGLLDLYEASFEERYLQLAFRLAEDMLELFWDEENGGFFFTADDAEKLIIRQKEIYDGAIPSGNSVAAMNLVRLFHISLDKKWEKKLEDLLNTFSAELSAAPNAYAQMLMAYQFALGPSQEIVLSGKKDDSSLGSLVDAVFDRFLPFKVVLQRPLEDKKGAIFDLAPFTKEQKPLDEKATAYLCENHICKLPVHDVDKFKELLDKTIKAQ